MLITALGVVGVGGYLYRQRRAFDPAGWHVLSHEALYRIGKDRTYYYQIREDLYLLERRVERNVLWERGQVRRDWKFVSRIRCAPHGGTLEMTWFDQHARVVKRVNHPISAADAQRQLNLHKKHSFIGQAFPSEQAVMVLLQAKGAKQRAACCGRKAYMKHTDGVIINCYDARTGKLLKSWRWYENRWEISDQLIFARWTLVNGKKRRVYEIRCSAEDISPPGR